MQSKLEDILSKTFGNFDDLADLKTIKNEKESLD